MEFNHEHKLTLFLLSLCVSLLFTMIIFLSMKTTISSFNEIIFFLLPIFLMIFFPIYYIVISVTKLKEQGTDRKIKFKRIIFLILSIIPLLMLFLVFFVFGGMSLYIFLASL